MKRPGTGFGRRVGDNAGAAGEAGFQGPFRAVASAPAMAWPAVSFAAPMRLNPRA